MIVGRQTLLKEHAGKDFNLPVLEYLAMNGSTMNTKFSKVASRIILRGQNGHILRESYSTDSVIYTLGKQESYAREVAIFNDGTKIFLNPVFRYKTQPLIQTAAVINVTRTDVLRSIGVLILIIWFSIVVKLLFPKAFQKIINHTNYGGIPNSPVPKNA